MSHIKDLKPDKRNARKHNPRNIGMIEKSLQELGAGRSILIDEDNNIIAGNGTIEAAGNAGITKLKIVDIDGDTIVAVRRKDLTAKQKKRMAVADNRTAELAEWFPDVLEELAGDGLLDGYFSENELSDILGVETALESPNFSEPNAAKSSIVLNIPSEHLSLVQSDLNQMRNQYPGLTYYDA